MIVNLKCLSNGDLEISDIRETHLRAFGLGIFYLQLAVSLDYIQEVEATGSM